MDIQELIDKKRIKRYLTARNKIIYPEGVYHVTHRAPGRELLFIEEKDYLHMFSLLEDVSKKFKWNIFSFAFMPNHLHILLKISEANLSEGIKKLCEQYAKYFNKKYERKGPVFSRPYRAALCLDDMYLLSISIYIHLNPFKAKLCERIDGYRWSSLKAYIDAKAYSFVDSLFVLRILNEKNINMAKDTYFKLLSRATGANFKNIIEYPSFIEKFKDTVRNILKKLNISTTSDNIEDEIDKFSRTTRLRRKEEILARKYLIEQLLSRGFKVKDIAERLKVGRKTIYDTLRVSS
ncbi:MAG: transposase [Candidatus Omnitrophota bacterium]|nr:transposase [Candidatus Omnitrophota bacterium]